MQKPSIYLKALFKQLETPFFSNAFSLLALQIAASLFGFLFWFIATHLFTTSQVGIGTGLLSAAMLIVSFAGLGFDEGLTYFLPVHEDKRGLINVYFSLSIITGSVFALIIVLLQPIFLPALHILNDSPINKVLFIICALILHLSAMQDSLFIAQRASKYVFIKGLFINLVRLPLIVGLLAAGELGLFLSLPIVTVFGFGGLIFYYVKKIDPIQRYRIDLRPKIWLPIIKFSIGNYLTAIIVTLPTTIIPLIILNSLGASIGAYFYIAWTIAGTLNMFGGPFGVTLFVEGRKIPDSINKNILKAAVVSLSILVPAVTILVIFAIPLLSIFGKSYSIESAVLVRILACSVIPLTIYGIAVGVLKAQGKIISLLVNGIMFSVLHIFGAWLGARLYGVVGVSWAILAARILSAFLAIGLTMQKKWVAKVTT